MKINIFFTTILLLYCNILLSQIKEPPERFRGQGPFDQLIIRGATLINGNGAPPSGPVDVVVENNKIVSIRNVGYPGLKIKEERRPKAKEGAKEIDAHGMYLSQKKNAIVVVMNTFNNVLEEVEIKDIPINKWINVVLRCQGRKMDTYVNGTIVHRQVFNSVPKQNYGDVWVTQRGGFDGMLSSLRYFSHALTGVEVENLVKAGPNLTADDSLKIFPPYFALRWFFSKPVLSQ